jgi:hypothetical protein
VSGSSASGVGVLPICIRYGYNALFRLPLSRVVNRDAEVY